MSVHSAIEKGLPTNVDAERFVLGSILLDDSFYIQAADRKSTRLNSSH